MEMVGPVAVNVSDWGNSGLFLLPFHILFKDLKMALTERTEIDQIEVVGDWNTQVRQATIIERDGEFVSSHLPSLGINS